MAEVTLEFYSALLEVVPDRKEQLPAAQFEGRLADKSGDVKEAEIAFREALKINPTDFRCQSLPGRPNLEKPDTATTSISLQLPAQQCLPSDHGTAWKMILRARANKRHPSALV